jgi:alpha-1,3-glucosyltransferase
MLKHIYIYLAPAYFVFLLRTYVLPTSASAADAGPLARLFTLGTITLLPPVLGFAPLLLAGLAPSAPAGPIGIMQQICSRLFPFARGLNHAYWAANFWALYTFADRVLLRVASLRPQLFASFIDGHAARNGLSSASRGLIGDTSFGVLPTITAGHCFLLTALPLLAFSLRLWTRPTYASFVMAITLSGLTSFIFGYHVHEKAILLPLLPLTLLAPLSHAHARLTLVLSVAGVVGLFPLLFSARESIVKIAYSIVWALCVFVPLNRNVFRPVPTNLGVLAHFAEHAYLLGFAGLLAYTSLLHPLLFPSPSQPLADVTPPSALSEAISKASSLVAPAATLVAAAVTPVVTAINSQTILPGVQAENVLPSSLAESASSLLAPATPAATSTPLEDAEEPFAETDIIKAEATVEAPQAVSEAASEASVSAVPGASEEVTGILQSASSIASEASESAVAALSHLTGSVAGVFSQTSEVSPVSTISAAAASATEAAADAVLPTSAPASAPISVSTQASPPVKEASLEFLPLMLTSVYCALGVMWVWARLSLVFWTGEGEEVEESTPAKPAVPRAASTVVANGR